MTPPDLSGAYYPVAIVGGGQAGLSMSHCLREAGIDHIVLEARQIAWDWRERRWDAFFLVTPNWQCKLPGFPYARDDADGFMNREQVIEYLDEYVASFSPPVVEGVRVTRLRRAADRRPSRPGHPPVPRPRSGVAPLAGGVFELSTTAGDFTAEQVVVATGPYHAPSIPRMAERLPPAIVQIHSSQYRNPGQLPAGAVLVVGSGQSGAQIAEDLRLAGRQVHLAVGKAPRVARFYRGRDCVAWLDDMGHYRKTIDDYDNADDVRLRVNHYVTGRDGGRDIDLRAFARAGMRLYGHLTRIDGARAFFADDLRASLDHADSVAESIKNSIDNYIEANGIDAPTEARYVPVWEPDGHAGELDLAAEGVTSVVWSTGFTRDHRWVEAPVFDGRGYPMHWRGVTNCPGLYFLGLPWQYTWGSGRLEGVGRDAEFLAAHIEASRRLADVCGTLTGAPPSLAAALPVG